MELVNKNLRFLRGKANLTQKELALRLDVKLPVIGSYEEGRSLPPIPTSIKIAQLFNVSLDMLLTRDVSESRHKTKAGKEKEILAITIDSLGDENVEFVSHKASAGYISEYSDTEYLKELPKISLPFLSKSHSYRAFEITGQSMLPVQSGDIIVGKYLDDIKKIKSSKTYVFVAKTNGIVYKRVFEFLTSSLLLVSDNPAYDPYILPFEDILEVWAFVVRMTQEEEQPDLSLRYADKIVNLKNR